jgi:Pilus assembly protein, PilP
MCMKKRAANCSTKNFGYVSAFVCKERLVNMQVINFLREIIFCPLSISIHIISILEYAMPNTLLKIGHTLKAITLGFIVNACVISTSVASSTVPITIDAREIKASALLLEIARLHKLDMVVGNRAFEVRLSINETFASPRAAIDSIVTRARLKASRKNDVLVIADLCTPEQPADTKSRTLNPLNPFSDSRVSLNFQQTDLATMLSLLQMASTRDTNSDAQINATNFSANAPLQIGAHLQNQSARRAYEAIAIATGTGLMATTTGEEFIVSQLAPKKGCKEITAVTIEAAITTDAADSFGMCPRLSTYPATANVDCQPLEFYKFSDITIRGYLKSGNELAALVETRDQLSWTISKANLLGENFAQVEAMTDKGLVIKELFINRYGYPFDRKLFLGFDGKQTALPD